MVEFSVANVRYYRTKKLLLAIMSQLPSPRFTQNNPGEKDRKDPE